MGRWYELVGERYEWASGWVLQMADKNGRVVGDHEWEGGRYKLAGGCVRVPRMAAPRPDRARVIKDPTHRVRVIKGQP